MAVGDLSDMMTASGCFAELEKLGVTPLDNPDIASRLEGGCFAIGIVGNHPAGELMNEKFPKELPAPEQKAKLENTSEQTLTAENVSDVKPPENNGMS